MKVNSLEAPFPTKSYTLLPSFNYLDYGHTNRVKSMSFEQFIYSRIRIRNRSSLAGQGGEDYE
jgi:hypothetical protein